MRAMEKGPDTTMKERGASKIHPLNCNRMLPVRKERACETRLEGGFINEGTLPVPGKEFANLTRDGPRESTCHGS